MDISAFNKINSSVQIFSSEVETKKGTGRYGDTYCRYRIKAYSLWLEKV
jgi:hypothetical protein